MTPDCALESLFINDSRKEDQFLCCHHFWHHSSICSQECTQEPCLPWEDISTTCRDFKSDTESLLSLSYAQDYHHNNSVRLEKPEEKEVVVVVFIGFFFTLIWFWFRPESQGWLAMNRSINTDKWKLQMESSEKPLFLNFNLRLCENWMLFVWICFTLNQLTIRSLWWTRLAK